MARGFGLTVENNYADILDIDDIELDWFQKMSEVNFDLGDEPETDDGGSRSDVIAWAGAAKPNGSTTATVDLQRITWYLFGFLDHYLCSAGQNGTFVHEFWGGENHELESFCGIAMYDMLKLAIFGLIVDGMKLECSDGAMTVQTDWLYANETYEILNENEEFVEPEELINSKIPVRFYDIGIKLNNAKLGGVQNSLSIEGSNDHDQDGAIGFGDRFPQEQPQAAKRKISLSLSTTLTKRTVKDIMDARYGKVDNVHPDKCRILTIPLELNIVQCENPTNSMTIKFPEVTLKSEFDLKGADRIESTLNMQTLGNGEVTLADGSTKVRTDMYVKLTNNVENLKA